MDNTCIIQGREIGREDIEQIRGLISSNPAWSRFRLSQEIAKAWNWQSGSGHLKDMAARSLLLKLEQRGELVLPLRRRAAARRLPLDTAMLFDDPVPNAINEPLADLLPLRLDVLTSKHPHRKIFWRYLARHHYLGYRGAVGENLAYLVRDRHGRDLACVLFGAAAWRVKPRDVWIGWDDTTRANRLSYLANNSRFLILPWVRVAQLASHILGRITRRLSDDWQKQYSHPIYLAETFVECERFHGTCYRAANWTCVGKTQGRSRQDRYKDMQVPIKDIYVYELVNNFRERLIHAANTEKM